MSAWWLAPAALTALMVIWYGVQRAWLHVMAPPGCDDALARPGCAGPDGNGCGCHPDHGFEAQRGSRDPKERPGGLRPPRSLEEQRSFP